MAKPKQTNSDLLTIEQLGEMREEVEKELGVDLLWGSDDQFKLKWLPTGISSFDKALGGGLPFNRVALVIGEFSAGKTTFVHLILKKAIEQNLSVVYVDAERAWNPEWAEALGVDPAKMLVVQPVTGEATFDTALAWLRRKAAVIVIDSLAALTPSVQLEAEENELLEKQYMGGEARMNNRGIKYLVNENKGSLVIIINQLRSTIGVTYGNPEILPGGKGQTFYNTQTIRVRRSSWIEEGTGEKKKRVGYRMRIRLEKNKVARPYEEAEAPFYFTGEFDEIASTIDTAIDLGVIQGKPPRYLIDFNGEELSYYGRPKLIEAVKSRPELLAFLNTGIENVDEVDL